MKEATDLSKTGTARLGMTEGAHETWRAHPNCTLHVIVSILRSLQHVNSDRYVNSRRKDCDNYRTLRG